ncbi:MULTISPECIES: hypothetical protein [Acidobacteriaceae]|uniref:hypothetical protein n=1 Tax=Acidobacteriaceae TaxID=204434 RepID=UPI00131DC687|nr:MULTISPECIES: hypothetical protein [Acidobacteriaceae]MDW5265715.1 hypothetical protein [Edaphobacter sp.]
MERKRVKGRFVAEDKGGVVRKEVAAPEANPHQASQQNPATPSRAKSLVGLLLNKWKRSHNTTAE